MCLRVSVCGLGGFALGHIIKIFGTFGYTGFFPIAPATFASAIFLGIFYFVPGGHWLANLYVALATLILSIPASTYLEKQYGKDPSCVVIDEVVGLQVMLVFAHSISLWGLLAVFILFRIFDIAKPWPINRSQNLPAGWGIVIDDFLAGIYGRVVLIILAIWFPSIGVFR